MATDEYLEKIERMVRELAQLEAEAKALQTAWLQEMEERAKKELAAAEKTFRQATETAQNAYQEMIGHAETTHQQAMAAANQRRYQALTSAQVTYTTAIDAVREDTTRLWRDAGLMGAPWDDSAWRSWQPGTIGSAQDFSLNQLGLRIGRLEYAGSWDTLTLPGLVPFIGARSLVIEAPTSARSAAAQAVQSALLRLLATLPPGKLRFTFIDPVGLGQNAAPFMHLADYDEALVTARAWTESRHIEQRLAELTEHMETVIQKYLRNEYTTIEDYNEQAGEIAEPYRVLAVFDFPTGFSEDAVRRLLSILQNGPRCGVYALVVADTAKPPPHGFQLSDLEQPATVIAARDGRFVWQDPDFQDCRLNLDSLPNTEMVNFIIKTVGQAAAEADNVEVPFERVAPPREAWWSGATDNGIQVALGPSGARRLQYLDLGRGTAQHALIAGKTGSGKSTLLHTLITNAALSYSPDELELYLVDFKKGVEFKGYAVHRLPHARVIAIESEREFGLSVLQGLDAELKQRGDRFRSARVDHIADYRRRAGERMPRILLIVDEFQEFFSEDDAVAAQASQILDRLVRQGRAFGIHVVLGSQTLAGAYSLSRSTIDQMAVRIALQCSEADSRLILADDNPAARLLSRPGEAIYNNANGMVEGNHPFQVAWLPDDERERLLQSIQTLAAQRHYRPAQSQLVFEGNAPANVRTNRLLEALLEATDWPEPKRRVLAWLGEPLAITAPTAGHFRRQSASNLLMVGRDDEAAAAMFAVNVVSLAAQHPPDRARFTILDFGAVDASYADLLSSLPDLLPHLVQHGRRRQLPEIIGGIAAELERRRALDDQALLREPAVYLFVFGLQRARDLRPEEDMAFSFGLDDEPAPPTPAQQFADILREGPELGIHTVAWCDTYGAVNRMLDRRSQREFEMRVAMQMSLEDSANLIDTPAAGKLGPHRAYFYSEDEGRLEKFRPYGLPDDSWLSWVQKQLRARVAGHRAEGEVDEGSRTG